MGELESIMLGKIKVIGDGEFTLLGTPDELITEFELVDQHICNICKEPQLRIHRKCKEQRTPNKDKDK